MCVGCTCVCAHGHEDVYVHASKERILPYIKDITSEVRFPDRKVILDMAFHGPHICSVSNSYDL